MNMSLKSKKIILFGTGNASVDFTQFLGHSISYYIDNNPQKWGTFFLNTKVYPPEQLLEEDPEITYN